MISKFNIYDRFRQLISSEFIKVTSKNSVQVMLRFAIGLINLKICSMWLGTMGMTLLGQFNSFIQIAANFSGGGINQGVVKLVSQYGSTNNRKHLIIGNSVFIILTLSLMISIVSFLFPRFISELIFKNTQYAIWVKYGGIIFLSVSLSNALVAVLNGLKKYKSYVNLNIWIALSTFSIGVLFIYYLNLNGAIIALYISSIINLILCIIYCRKEIKAAVRIFKFSGYISKRLFGFGLMLMVAATIEPAISIFIRNIIVSEYSFQVAGWWEGVSRISKTFFGLCISTISLYYIPKISDQLLGKKLNSVIIKSVFVIMPFVIVVLFLMYLMRDYIIAILFTREFSGMNKLFLFQNIGDAFRVLNWFFAITIIIKEKIKLYIVSEVGTALVYALLSAWIIPLLGPEYCTLPYMLDTIFYFIVSQFIYRKYII